MTTVDTRTLTVDIPGEAIRHMEWHGSWENEGGPGGATNTSRSLTHSLDYGEEGLAMQATRGFDDLPPHIRRNIDRRPDGCWLWTRSKSRDGYGWASLHNKTHQAHRLVYKLLVGDPPAGMVLDHLCRVRHCVNPAHLQPVTNHVNLMRSPIVPAGQRACLRCGSSFIRTGRTTSVRRCPACVAAWTVEYRERRNALARARSARRRAERQP